jgi:hypothetical protein
MLSNFPRLFQASDEISTRPVQTLQAGRFGGGVLDRVREALCGLHGHDHLLQFQQGRMFLRCFSCGHVSPGWELNEAPPTVTADTDARRQTFAHSQKDRCSLFSRKDGSKQTQFAPVASREAALSPSPRTVAVGRRRGHTGRPL